MLLQPGHQFRTGTDLERCLLVHGFQRAFVGLWSRTVEVGIEEYYHVLPVAHRQTIGGTDYPAHAEDPHHFDT
ncbi:MAG: hypothetical protein NVSMB42_25900 [Herpetosiphon sp.]